MIKRLTVFISLITALSGLSLAQEQGSESLTLDDCINTAIRHNPLILSSIQQYQASLARIHQAKAFEQPSINWDSDLQDRLFDFRNPGEWYFGISQPFEFPGKQSVRGKIAGKESEEILQEIDLLKLDIVYQVKQAFYGLLLAQETLRYVQQDLELSQDYLDKARLKHEAGDVAQVEVLRAQVEVSKAQNKLRQATSDVRLSRAYLNYLMARRKYESLEIAGELKSKPLALDLELLKKRALSFRPEIKKINFSLEREQLQRKSAQLSYLPDFELGVNRHKVTGEGDWWDVTLSFNVPLFFWQPAKGEIAEAQANILGLKKEVEHLENTIALEVEDAYLNAVSAANQIKLFEDEILAQAEEVYNMFLFSYQEGEIGGFELIEARRTLIESRTSYADALFNYRAAIAALEKSIGQILEGDSNHE
jgi:cobalt-zinc-cadmium efflux system outer membrane protein